MCTQPLLHAACYKLSYQMALVQWCLDKARFVYMYIYQKIQNGRGICDMYHLGCTHLKEPEEVGRALSATKTNYTKSLL